MQPAAIHFLLARDSAALSATLGLEASAARIEVQCLMQRALGVSRAYLLAHPEQMLDAEQQRRYAVLLAERTKGVPVAYVLGEREFFGLPFKVTPDTLIPRPETELLVELSLECLPAPRHVGVVPLRVLDLGTGSGAVAVAIAHARPDVEVLAVDRSYAALAVARTNAQRLGTGNVRFLCSDWMAALGAVRFDLIVSNPPYIAAGDPHLAQGDLRFEPSFALVSGADGLQAIRHLVQEAPHHLTADGWLLLEHGYDQAHAVRTLLEHNTFADVFSEKDLAGIERVSGGRSVFQPRLSIGARPGFEGEGE